MTKITIARLAITDALTNVLSAKVSAPKILSMRDATIQTIIGIKKTVSLHLKTEKPSQLNMKGRNESIR